GNAAGQHLLLLDDLRVEVRAEGAGQRIGDVDAVEVVDVVRRGADDAADVGVVHTRLGGGIVAVAGLDARDELQVALVAAAGRQRFHDVQVQGGAHHCRGGVHG